MDDKIVSLKSRQPFARRQFKPAVPATIVPIRNSWRLRARIAVMRTRLVAKNTFDNVDEALFPTNIVGLSALSTATMPLAIFVSPMAVATVGAVVTYKSIRDGLNPARPHSYVTLWNIFNVLNHRHDA